MAIKSKMELHFPNTYAPKTIFDTINAGIAMGLGLIFAWWAAEKEKIAALNVETIDENEYAEGPLQIAVVSSKSSGFDGLKIKSLLA
jgi:hypothetical protein